MDTLAIFGLQVVLSLVVYALLANWYIAPWLATKPTPSALTALIFPHAFRHLGLAFLVPGLVGQPLPSSFAAQAAFGDLVSGLLALLALVALRGRFRLAIPLVWFFNIVGTVDLLNALRQADAVPHLQTTWYIPTFWVPLLLVTHTMIFARLLRRTPSVLPVALAVSTTVAVTNVQAQEASPEDYRAGVLSAEFPYESKYVELLGSTMHYIDQGEGDVFLFLHGNPTSSYLWRNVMRYVAPHGRIVAVDNIGFGKSDKPDGDYTFQSHFRYTEAFISALDLRNMILVVHDWGSVLGLYYAIRHGANVKGVVLIEPLTPPAFPMESLATFGPAAELFRRFRDPVDGEKALIDENLFIEVLLANATITRQMTQAEMDVYRAPFLEPETRYPIYVWPNELPIGGAPARNVRVVEQIGEWLRNSNTPKLLQYASPGVFMPPHAAEWAAENFRNIETQFVGYGRHFLQEDNPEVIGRGIAEWYRRLEPPGGRTR